MKENNDRNLDKYFMYGEEWNKFMDSYRELINYYTRSILPMKLNIEPAINSMANTLKKITPIYINYIEQYNNQIVNIFNKSLNSTMQVFLKTNFEAINASINNIFKNYDWTNILKNYNDIINNINLDEIDINSDGSIQYENENIEVRDENINEALETLKNIEKDTSDIKKNIKMKKPIIIIIIIFIVNGIVSGFLNKCGETIFELIPKAYNNYIDENVDNNKEKFIKNFRIVNAQELNVREEASSESKLIGKLYLNQCVEVIEKVNYWTKIKYVNKEKEINIVGWVYNRYLSCFDEGTSSLIEE